MRIPHHHHQQQQHEEQPAGGGRGGGIATQGSCLNNHRSHRIPSHDSNNSNSNMNRRLRAAKSTILLPGWAEAGAGGTAGLRGIINSCRVIWKMQVVFKFFRQTFPCLPPSFQLSLSLSLCRNLHILPLPATAHKVFSCCFIAQIEKAMGKVRPRADQGKGQGRP